MKTISKCMTYDEVKEFVKRNYDEDVETCHIAHVKELNGMPVRKAHNRIGVARVKPCPLNLRPLIEAAFRSNGDIK